MKISLFERIVLMGWAIAVLYVFAAFRGQIRSKGFPGELIEFFLSHLSAGYLQ
jgi:hypothetical protein